MLRPLLAAGLVAIAACAPLATPEPPHVLVLGEQHDAREHPRLHQRALEELVAAGRLAALVLEMAEDGRSTAGLPRDADAGQVRAALAWDEKAWPWARYEAVVMAAVRAGAPVAGANIPRGRLREAGGDFTLDAAVGAAVMRTQVEAMRAGHCGLLPDSQLTPMARMQVARDRSMARVVAQLAVPGKTVVLVTGARHANAHAGVPLHLPPALRVQVRTRPAEAAAEDHCARLRRQETR